MAESVGAALMGLPKVAVLGSNITLHGLADDQVAKLLELGVGVTLGTELGADESGASLLNELEEGQVLDASHLDDLGDTVANPALVESSPEAAVGQSEHGRMVGTVKVLEAVAIAAGSGRRASIDTGDDGGAEHNVGGVSVVEGSSEATDVSDDTATHDKDGLVSGNLVVLQLDEDLFHVLDILVDLVATVDELHELDVEVGEVSLELLAEVNDNLVVDEGDAAAKGLVDVGEDGVLGVKDTVRDLDGGGQSSRHDGLDGLRIGGSESQTVAVAVDGGGVHGVGVDLLKGVVVVDVHLGVLDVRLHDVILEADGRKLAGVLHQVDQCGVVAREAHVESLQDLLQEEQVLTERQVGVELELLGESEEVEVVAEGVGEIFIEDREAGQEHQQVGDGLLREDVLHEVLGLGISGHIDAGDGVDGGLEAALDLGCVNLVHAVVVESLDVGGHFSVGGFCKNCKSSGLDLILYIYSLNLLINHRKSGHKLNG